LTAKEEQLTVAEAELRNSEQTATRFAAALDGVSKRLKELGIDQELAERIHVHLEQATNEAEARLRQLGILRQTGESLALRLGQTAAARVSEELRREGQVVRVALSEREETIAARNRTGETAQRVIEALREASSAVVDERLKEITPLLQSIYARMDPIRRFARWPSSHILFEGRGTFLR